jgi:hypothetical protein
MGGFWIKIKGVDTSYVDPFEVMQKKKKSFKLIRFQ